MKPINSPTKHTLTLISEQTYYDGDSYSYSTSVSVNKDDMGKEFVQDWLNNQALRGIGYYVGDEE